MKVGLSHGEAIELFNSVIVVGNLWEGEGFLVDLTCANQEFWLFEAFFFDLLSELDGSIKVLLVKRYAKGINFLVHFLNLISIFSFLNLIFLIFARFFFSSLLGNFLFGFFLLG